MSAILVTMPFQVFTDNDGNPLESGYVYIGQENLNPITTPISVYWDEAMTIPAAQPLRTTNGFLSRNGRPSNIFTAQNYSVLVQDRAGVLLYSSLNTPMSITESSLPWVDASAYGHSKNDTTITAAMAYASTAFGASAKYALLIKRGDWTISGNLTIPENVQLIFENGAVLNIATGVTVTYNGPDIQAPFSQIFNCSGSGVFVSVNSGVHGLWFGQTYDNVQSCLNSSENIEIIFNGEWGIIDISQSNRILRFLDSSTVKLPDNTVSSIATENIPALNITGSNISIFGSLNINGNLANNSAASINPSSRIGALHVAGENIFIEKSYIYNSNYVGVSVGSNVDSASNVRFGPLEIVNPRSYATSFWDVDRWDVESIFVQKGADTVGDARVRTGNTSSSLVWCQNGSIGSVISDDAVVVEARSRDVSISNIQCVACKCEDSFDISISNITSRGVTAEAFSFAILTSERVRVGSIIINGHNGAASTPGVRFSEVIDCEINSIIVNGTISNAWDMDIRSADGLNIGSVICANPVGTGGGFLFDYDAGYSPQRRIYIGSIISYGHTGNDVELQNYDNLDMVVGYINSDAVKTITTNKTPIYLEGVYTSTLTSAGGSITMNGGQDTLYWVKIGRMVTVIGRIGISSVSSPTGALTMNIPFTSADTSELSGHSCSMVRASNTGVFTGVLNATITEGANIMTISIYNGSTISDAASIMQSSVVLVFSFSYLASS